MRKLPYIIILQLLAFFLQGCKDDATGPDMTESNLNLTINGLANTGNTAMYEGWIIVDGEPVSTGTFSVDDNGNMSKTSFMVDSENLAMAEMFVLTIEPSPDSDPAPSATHILAGNFSSNSASLTVSHQAALGHSFSSVTGKYILATPTNGSETNEKSGIWFLDISSGSPMAGLNLPMLPTGWKYEGWAVKNGMPLTSGKFDMNDMSDESAPYSGSEPGPPFPGEDYLMNAPAGISFPTDFSGGKAVITIEPDPDFSTSPFNLKPLAADIPASAADHTVYDLMKNTMFPTGTATR